MDAITWSRFQFGLLATFHYLFPALTMGLALIIFILKFLGYKKNDSSYDAASRLARTATSRGRSSPTSCRAPIRACTTGKR
jgi:cytochrome bd-type quinol oxidase subunit 1